jgi:uncharacterized membrane protein YvlD (DUF360 family)
VGERSKWIAGAEYLVNRHMPASEVAVIRFLVHCGAMTLSMILLVSVLPGIEAPNPAGLVLGSLFLGLVSAAMRPVMKVADWPVSPLAVAVISFTVNALIMAAAEPVTMSWQVAVLWQALLAVTVLTVVASSITLIGERPYESSV